jgi:hypothetical protein
LAFTAACLTGIATLPAAHAQTAYETAAPADDPGGNSMGTPGPNPGGPGLTPYTGGAPGAAQPYPDYPTAPSAASTSNTDMATNGSVTYPPQPPGWSPEQNIRQSEHYTWLLQHNRPFREARERRECGPITDSQLHQQCLASFAEYSPWAGSAPAYGSSSSSRNYTSRSGR